MYHLSGLVSKNAWPHRSLVCEQAPLWGFYEEASVFGKEVHTTGGSRGSSRAFFVPSLSAMQLFVPADSNTQPSGSVCALSDAAAAQVCLLQSKPIL